jgi:peptidoglycan L-alanyl-D-glutamate endopeptidase CwlK
MNLIVGLLPGLVELAKKHKEHCQHDGVNWIMIQGYRTPEYQLELYGHGRRLLSTGEWEVVDEKEIVTNALPEHAPHCRRAAYDIACLDRNGHIDWQNLEPYRKAGILGKELGLVWGGDFKSMKADFGHFALPDAIWKKLPL